MRVAALCDIHGNLPALEAVLGDVDADLVVVGGDLLGEPYARECLDRLLELGDRVRFVRGNADREALAFADIVASWPLTVDVEVAGLGRALFCHGSPRSDEEILTKVSPDERVAAALDGVDAPLVVCGHTHVQFDRHVAGYRLVNPGSVGMPYEGRPGAFWAVFGPDVELRCTKYDVEAAAAALDAAGATDRAEWLREPPDPDEVSAYFEGQAGA